MALEIRASQPKQGRVVEPQQLIEVDSYRNELRLQAAHEFVPVFSKESFPNAG
jgi:hypothetical protein